MAERRRHHPRVRRRGARLPRRRRTDRRFRDGGRTAPIEPTASSPAKGTTNFNTLAADFYRPLVERLRRTGIHPVGRGGWRGRWRSLQTGHDGAVYATQLDDGTVMVFLSLSGTAHQKRFRALREHEEDIAGQVEASPCGKGVLNGLKSS